MRDNCTRGRAGRGLLGPFLHRRFPAATVNRDGRTFRILRLTPVIRDPRPRWRDRRQLRGISFLIIRDPLRSLGPIIRSSTKWTLNRGPVSADTGCRRADTQSVPPFLPSRTIIYELRPGYRLRVRVRLSSISAGNIVRTPFVKPDGNR